MVNNRDLSHPCQGLTADHVCYIDAFFPVATALLPDPVEGDRRAASEADLTSYLSETTALLDGLLPAGFAPDLALVDAVVASLRLDPQGAGCAGPPHLWSPGR